MPTIEMETVSIPLNTPEEYNAGFLSGRRMGWECAVFRDPNRIVFLPSDAGKLSDAAAEIAAIHNDCGDRAMAVAAMRVSCRADVLRAERAAARVLERHRPFADRSVEKARKALAKWDQATT